LNLTKTNTNNITCSFTYFCKIYVFHLNSMCT